VLHEAPGDRERDIGLRHARTEEPLRPVTDERCQSIDRATQLLVHAFDPWRVPEFLRALRFLVDDRNDFLHCDQRHTDDLQCPDVVRGIFRHQSPAAGYRLEILDDQCRFDQYLAVVAHQCRHLDQWIDGAKFAVVPEDRERPVIEIYFEESRGYGNAPDVGRIQHANQFHYEYSSSPALHSGKNGAGLGDRVCQ
jgi:hypothetical protein